MIPARELVSAEALRRYDEDGEPVYSTHERVLLTLRWFGWVTAERLYEALDIDPSPHFYDERQKHSVAIRYWIKRGRVEQRHDRGLVEYRLIHPSKWGDPPQCMRCPSTPVEGKTMCQRHLDYERDYKAKRRAA